MAVRRVPHEGARWWSAVFIVAAIAAVAAGLRHVSVAPPSPPALASRQLPWPMLPVLAPPPGVPDGLQAHATAPVGPADRPAEPDSGSAPTTGPTALRSAAPIVDPPGDPVLASHAVHAALAISAPPLVAAPPFVTAPPFVAVAAAPAPADETLIAADPGAPGLIEMPAVALTRAVSVAGKGILTGLRATTAVFRAAF
jgi:hypothetical protein